MRSQCSTFRLALAFFFCATAFVSESQAATIAFWSGNGTANDSVNGHNGTLENGAGFAAGQFGQQAFSLSSGSSQYVSVPDSAAWDFGSNPFTIAMYANFTTISPASLGGGGNALMGHDEGGGATNKWFFSYMSDGSLGFHINGGGPSVFLTSPSTSAVAPGTWNLFAITRSGSTFTFYENGVSLGTTSSSAAIPSIAAPLTIGQTGEGIGFVDGRLQNVAIADQALSASEITALVTPVPEPSTIVSWMIASGAWGVHRFCRRRKRATGGG